MRAASVGDVSDPPSPTRRARPTPAGTLARKASAPSSMPARPANGDVLSLPPVRRSASINSTWIASLRSTASRSATVSPAIPPPTTTTRFVTSWRSCPADELGEAPTSRRGRRWPKPSGRTRARRPRPAGGPRCRGRTAPRGGRTRTRTGTPARPGRRRRPSSSIDREDVGSDPRFGVPPCRLPSQRPLVVGEPGCGSDGGCRCCHLVRVRVALGRGSVRAASGR